MLDGLQAALHRPPDIDGPPGAQLLTPEVIAQQRVLTAMFLHLDDAGYEAANFTKEVWATARAAAAQGEFVAAKGLYELVGKALGSFAPEQHIHMHGTADGRALRERMAGLPDDALASIIAGAKPAEFLVRASDPAPVPAAKPPFVTDAEPLHV